MRTGRENCAPRVIAVTHPSRPEDLQPILELAVVAEFPSQDLKALQSTLNHPVEERKISATAVLDFTYASRRAIAAQVDAVQAETAPPNEAGPHPSLFSTTNGRAPERNRTSDTFFRREVLYPLSYQGGPCRV